MRTKSLLLTAVLALAGISSSMAEVYSVNAVGFVNVEIKPGFNLVSNPLNGTPNNNLGTVLPNVPLDTALYKWKPTGGYAIFVFSEYEDATQPDGINEGWLDSNGNVASSTTFSPGEGGFIKTPAGNPGFTLTFVGEVAQSVGGVALENPIPAGFSIRSSQVPQKLPLNDRVPSSIAAHLNFPAVLNDTIYFWRDITPTRRGYAVYTFSEYENPSAPDGIGHAWLDGSGNPVDIEPAFVGEAFFIKKVAPGKTWTRVFSVNP